MEQIFEFPWNWLVFVGFLFLMNLGWFMLDDLFKNDKNN